ncbi:DOPA 4,5-dioxygenase family protein [Endozoicomonas sp.]|uniref:DOPA 4,5-dioxygenase family protein n=1 Tax=Endozoicomonas sp. TaxID=1892382 RepID=UPI0028841C10|nr:DOPA 4,5-dioxygenase family protein [Endozoicomonas sp.]
MADPTGYHAHIYFDEKTIEQAEKLAAGAGSFFDLTVGRVHRKPVGPHPMWSCQLAFKPEAFGKVIPWLSMNRNGLTIFIHGDTGNFIRDHTDHAIWMGSMMELNLSDTE